MIPRRLIAVLVVALPLLLVAFAVVMGGYGIALSAGDGAGARGLWWVAMTILMLLIADLVLLVGSLGLNHITAREESGQDWADQESAGPLQ